MLSRFVHKPEHACCPCPKGPGSGQNAFRGTEFPRVMSTALVSGAETSASRPLAMASGNLTFSSRPGPSQSVLVAGGRRRPSHRQHPSEPGNEAFFSCPSSSSRKLAVHYSTVDSSCPSQSPRIFPVGADFCDTVLGNFYGFFSTIFFFPLCWQSKLAPTGLTGWDTVACPVGTDRSR